LLDGRLPLEVGQLIAHIVQINPANSSPASDQIKVVVIQTNRCADGASAVMSARRPTIRP
jgi:hypothetical protein